MDRVELYQKIQKKFGHHLTIEQVNKEIETLDRIKKEKYKRIRPFLCCPACRSELQEAQEALVCETCSQSYGNNSHVDFLPPGIKTEYDIIDTDSVSANTAFVLPEKYAVYVRDPEKIVLDCGSGYKALEFIETYPNIICYEIVAYPSTDIIGVGERLPFKDGTFDVVLSLAVLEHVKDPSTCAAEIKRVLKAGGTVIADIPFLQPYHGYPHHYYNMTPQGARSLFEGMEIRESGIPPWGEPIFALKWMLRIWKKGLKKGSWARLKFNLLPMSYIIKSSMKKLQKERFVRELKDDAKNRIGCVTSIIARKSKMVK